MSYPTVPILLWLLAPNPQQPIVTSNHENSKINERIPVVYYLPFEIDTQIAVTPENFASTNPSRRISVDVGDVRFIWLYLSHVLPSSKDSSLVYHQGETRLLIQLPHEQILVDGYGIVKRGVSIAMLRPDAFLRLGSLLEGVAERQGKGEICDLYRVTSRRVVP